MTGKELSVNKGTNIVNIEDQAMSIESVMNQALLIQNVMKKVMKEDEHYGIVPGCGKKPSLYKSGAEKIGVTFRISPEFKITKTEMKNGHREYEVITTMTHIPTGNKIGQGVGSCSTMESKYRYRDAEKVCPKCGGTAIIKGKAEYGGGWLCFVKKGGCGAKYKDGDVSIESQKTGKVEYDNPADYYNTVFKMAKKRSHVDAVLTSTAASDFFSQDIEDLKANGAFDPKPIETKCQDVTPEFKLDAQESVIQRMKNHIREMVTGCKDLECIEQAYESFKAQSWWCVQANDYFNELKKEMVDMAKEQEELDEQLQNNLNKGE